MVDVKTTVSALCGAVQERMKSLESKADEEKTRSETRLQDIRDRFQTEDEMFPLKFADAIPKANTATATEQPPSVTDRNNNITLPLSAMIPGDESHDHNVSVTPSSPLAWLLIDLLVSLQPNRRYHNIQKRLKRR